MSQLILLNIPIGNPGDITSRVYKSLQDGIFFFVEDTRSFKRLLSHFEISFENKVIRSFHDHSNDSELNRIFKIIGEGNTVYYCSEAGSPLVSDPAFSLIKKAIELNVSLDSFSGISSVINALELSGLPATPFSFHGFLSRDKSPMVETFKGFSNVGGTHVFFEAGNRLKETLNRAYSIGVDFDICVAKELTKTFQTVYRFSSNELLDNLDHINYLGEFVIIFHFSKGKRKNLSDDKLEKLAQKYMEKPTSKGLTKILAQILGQSTSEIYSKLNQN